MKKPYIKIPGSVTAPKGFSASGVFCDIKTLGTGKGSDKGLKKDLALIVSDQEAVVAGMFTTNQVKAAPVRWCLHRLASGKTRGVVINSGNANACTGEKGVLDTKETASLTASILGTTPDCIWVCSTGRIGLPLPMDRLRTGIDQAYHQLGSTRKHATDAAEAILTSDARKKQIALEVQIGSSRVRIGGICKGAGMIEPGMSVDGLSPAPRSALHATMLAFITTDAKITQKALQAAIEQAVALSFNRISVDGDMSTNDTVMAMANGTAGNPLISKRSAKDLTIFKEALNHLTLEMARLMVRDGEGVSRMINLHLKGALTATEADAAARTVGRSSLVKTSWFGGDPNWGRVMDALGYSQATIDERLVDIGYAVPGNSRIYFALKKGTPTQTHLSVLRKITQRREFDLHINLNLGKAATTFITSDLTEDYVDFNKGE